MASLKRRAASAFMRFFFKHLYTTAARVYDVVAWTTSMGQWRTWQRAALIDFDGGRVLEIGHGPGHLLLDLHCMKHEVYGLDASRQMTELARDRFRRHSAPVITARGVASALPFPSTTFSTVITTFPSEYILDSETIRAIHRVLEPGGKWIIIGLAEITGRAVYDRFAALLYRATGQSGYPEEAYHVWLHQLKSLDFSTQLDLVEQPRARVLRIVADKDLTVDDQ